MRIIFPALCVCLWWAIISSNIAEKRAYSPAETMCALICHVDKDCNQYAYNGNNQPAPPGTTDIVAKDNCILASLKDFPIYKAVKNMVLKTITTTNNAIHTLDQMSHHIIQGQALEAGFDKSLTLESGTIFLKEVSSNDDYDKAMLKCLTWGGILPIEDTDEIVDQMSILAGDHTTPRFISLAQEASVATGLKSLVWTSGQVIWTQGEDMSKCPRCQNWTFQQYGRQVARINPISKMYENISPSQNTSKYFCQYLSGNLATRKRVLVSSSNKQPDKRELSVDGYPFQDIGFWHSGDKVPQGEWITVDLGQEFRVSYVLFLSRSNSNSFRNQNMQVWIGGSEPVEGVALDTTGRKLCSMYPFQQYGVQLSGVTCPTLILGQFVSLLNSPTKVFLQINELAIYGLSTLTSG